MSRDNPGDILTRPGSGSLPDDIRIPTETGPMFLVHAIDDDQPGARPEQSLARYGALRRAGVPVELPIDDESGHGFGVRKFVPAKTCPRRSIEAGRRGHRKIGAWPRIRRCSSTRIPRRATPRPPG